MAVPHLQSHTGDLTCHRLHDTVVAGWNLSAPSLVQAAIERGEGMLADNGALVVRTGKFTGRSPKDKYLVRDASTESTVHWGPVNQPMSQEAFDRLFDKVRAHWSGREVFVQDLVAGTDPAYSLRIRAITSLAWHNLFARQLLLRLGPGDHHGADPDFTIVFAPTLEAVPAEDGTGSGTCIALSFERKMVLILGTSYAGELKKSVFTILNYLLPEQGVFPMHCSANAGVDGSVALFFGLSGTGKTTLSADPDRSLIGDDEHGWSSQGVFNFEGGCYAKCIRLSHENEPQIWNAIRFGSVLENVVADPDTRHLNYDADTYTENTRAAYPVDFIERARIPGIGGHPNHVVFLTADAFGVLPPISRLTPEQAMYHFLSGYTAKLAGTERGLGAQPQAAFSACFGEPFLPRHPEVYAQMLGEQLRRHEAQCWLLNTGWVGGAYGTGHRIRLPFTRAMVHAALTGALDNVPYTPHSVFRVPVPATCPGVPESLLDPASQWQDQEAYDRAARDLAGRFRKNFEKFGTVSKEISEAGPA